MRNEKLGKEYEQKALSYLKEKGYWATFLNPGKNGQPCDIVAIDALSLEKSACLIDVKHCIDSFDFYRIEPNQRMAFNYANYFNIPCYFLLWVAVEAKFYWLDFQDVLKGEKNGIHSWKPNRN